jgi:UDP-N-acetylglucosamine acyltransferase
MSTIHPTAVVAAGAELGADIEIGPYCVIGPNVKIGAGTRLMSHVVVEGWTTIGQGCRLFPFACVGTQTQDLKYKGGKTFVVIGDRTTLREYVTVNACTNEGDTTSVGSDCSILAYCHVAHACKVGNGVIMSNCATLAGDVHVEDMAIIGGLTGVHQFVRIGSMAMIGGCSAVRKDVPPYMLVAGNPTEVHGPNLVGLQRRGVPEETRHKLKEAYRLLYRKQLNVRDALETIRREVESCPEIEHLIDFVSKSERGIA